jgi:hypothetical protein
MGMIWLTALMTFKYLGKNYPKLKPLRALGPLLVRVAPWGDATSLLGAAKSMRGDGR